MKTITTHCAALLVAVVSLAGCSQPKGSDMTHGLTKAYEAQCNGVTFALWYSPQSDIAHMRDAFLVDFARDRMVMVVTNSQPPASRRIAFTEPKPLASFARLLKREDGSWVDISVEQLDPFHAGHASKVNTRFEAVGDVFTSTTYYPVFTTLADPQNIDRGDYVLRWKAFPFLEVEGQPCMMNLPDLSIRVR